MGWLAGYSIECKFAAALTLRFRVFEIKIYGFALINLSLTFAKVLNE